MSGRSAQSNNRGSDLFGYFVSGKFKEYHTNQFAAPFTSSGLTATGGVISDYTSGSDVYRAHIFTSSGALNVTALGDFGDTVDYLVVAGGGSGGGAAPYSASDGGGGGAGGFRTNVAGHPLASPSPFPVSTSPGAYTVTIGAGGAGALSDRVSGGPSSFGPITSTGGGGGAGAPPSASALPGGSGGGGGGDAPSGGSGNSGGFPQPEGNPGGNGGYSAYPPQYDGGGGGGAGSAGATTPGQGGGPGGTGSPISITGTDTYYAGGGGGGAGGGSPAAGGNGGTGGGGAGASEPTGQPGTPGTYSTGGGGGGGSTSDSSSGGNGGSGIVVVRYQIGQLTATAKATGGAISFYSGKTIHAFTNSGSFVTNPGFSETVEYFMVAGGGGGGGSSGGGGGAGGYLTGTSSVAHPAPLTVTVGSGGSREIGNGGDTSVNFPAGTLTAAGGGHGGSNFTGSPGTPGTPGGSGGGSLNQGSSQGNGNQYGPTSPLNPAPAPGQGNDGAAGGFNPTIRGGGGGGAGGAGSNAAGGVGIQMPATFRDPRSAPGPGSTPISGGGLGTPGPSGQYWFAGGGGAGTSYSTPAPGAIGGAGGGGTGGIQAVGTAAVQSTGGGGGGGGYTPGEHAGANGGSGIVLIAYPS